MTKKKPLKRWRLDAGFVSYEVTVTARTKGEARKKAMAKLARVPIKKLICKHTTFLDTDD
jgi:hypothetical protein